MNPVGPVPKRVAIYVRVSTFDQNPDYQRADVERYARQRGFTELLTYEDRGVSGTRERRPGLDKLMRDAHQRRFDAVLVWKFDRFARSLKHLIDSLEEFRVLGIDFISFTEGIDTTTPSGQLLFHIVGAVAQFERDLIVERVRAGMAHARAIGKRIGRPRAAVDVEQVVVLRNQGKSLREIATVMSIPVSRVRRALARAAQTGPHTHE